MIRLEGTRDPDTRLIAAYGTSEKIFPLHATLDRNGYQGGEKGRAGMDDAIAHAIVQFEEMGTQTIDEKGIGQRATYTMSDGAGVPRTGLKGKNLFFFLLQISRTGKSYPDGICKVLPQQSLYRGRTRLPTETKDILKESVCQRHHQINLKYAGLSGLAISQAASIASRISCGSPPFLAASIFCSICVILEAPNNMPSPFVASSIE